MVATCGLRESLMTKAMPPPFAPDPPAERGKEKDRVSSRSQVGDLGLVTGRAQPGLRQQHDVDVVVLNEGGYVGPPPGSADESCIEEADKESYLQPHQTIAVFHLTCYIYRASTTHAQSTRLFNTYVIILTQLTPMAL